jgi:hypothetical protein
MDPDGPRIRKLLVLAVAGEAEIVIVISLGQLGSTGSSMGIMTIKTKNPCIKMSALLKVKPLLMMGFRMGLRISPDSGLKLIAIGQGLSYPIRSIFLVIPGEFKGPVWNADPSRMALAAYLQASLVL